MSFLVYGVKTWTPRRISLINKIGLHLAENTDSLFYKEQPVNIFQEMVCLLRESYETPKYT